MGLGFHIGQGGINNLGEFIGEMEMNEHHWLQKNGFIIEGKTGHFPDDHILSLPYLDDVILTHEQVLEIKSNFDLKKKEMEKIPGFKSAAAEKMELILKILIANKKGLSTCAD